MKAAIITPAFNRLEYTTRCVNVVRQNTFFPDYEHIVVNNNSTDGTKEWLDWVTSKSSDYFSRVKPLHLSENIGGWGGIIAGAKIADRPDYIVQLDNDMEVPPRWLMTMIDVLLQQENVGVVALKRGGVQQVLTPTTLKLVPTVSGNHFVGDITVSVGMFVTRADDFFEYAEKVPKGYFYAGAVGKRCLKIDDMLCQQIEGWDGSTYLQQEKYLKPDITLKTGE
jgi:GT2 family glycosyltransferase